MDCQWSQNCPAPSHRAALQKGKYHFHPWLVLHRFIKIHESTHFYAFDFSQLGKFTNLWLHHEQKEDVKLCLWSDSESLGLRITLKFHGKSLWKTYSLNLEFKYPAQLFLAFCSFPMRKMQLNPHSLWHTQSTNGVTQLLSWPKSPPATST